MKNILLVNECYCDGKPLLGFSNSRHNLINTFLQTQPQYNLFTIHIDEAAITYETHVNNILPKYCKKHKIDAIVFCLLGRSKYNPSNKTYKQLKNQGIYTIFIWPDTGPEYGIGTIAKLGKLADLHVSFDNPTSPFHDTVKFADNHLRLWVPQDKLLYFNQLNKDIPASFIGSTANRERIAYLNCLKTTYPELLVMGGQRESRKLSYTQYAELIRRSKININFSVSLAAFFQTKGRIFEVLASGSMLLESKNPSTATLFTPNKDYVEFNSPDELVEKIKYYLSHEEERVKIAEQGHQTYLARYTAKHFWDAVMTRAESDTNPNKLKSL